MRRTSSLSSSGVSSSSGLSSSGTVMASSLGTIPRAFRLAWGVYVSTCVYWNGRYWPRDLYLKWNIANGSFSARLYTLSFCPDRLWELSGVVRLCVWLAFHRTIARLPYIRCLVWERISFQRFLWNLIKWCEFDISFPVLIRPYLFDILYKVKQECNLSFAT